MKGRLGAWQLYAGINQAVYVNNYTEAAVVSVSVCNRNHTSAFISIANSTSQTSPSAAEWIEYEVEIMGKGVLERTGIIISPGEFLIVQSSVQNVNAVVWGTELGTEIAIPVVLTQNTGVAPSWATSATLPDITSSGYVEFTISAT